jgi:hypothetical protein
MTLQILILFMQYTAHLLDGRSPTAGRSKIFLLSTISKSILGPTQPPIQWEPGPIPPGVKRPGRETYHSLPSSNVVKNSEAKPQLPHVFMACSYLIKHTDNFTLPPVAHLFIWTKILYPLFIIHNTHIMLWIFRHDSSLLIQCSQGLFSAFVYQFRWFSISETT